MYEKRKKDDRDRRACRLHQRKERERDLPKDYQNPWQKKTRKKR